jgi:predicted nicotinamide N-methyase
MALSKVALEASCVVLSDGDVKAVDLLRENLLHNGIGSGSGDDDPSVVMAEHLVWGDDENGGDGKDGSTDRFSDRCRSLLDNCWRAEDEVKFDCIVAGDVLYKGDLPGLFFQTVQRFLSQGGTVWLCHVPRANVTHEIVVAAAQASGLEVVERVRASDDETAGFVGEDCPRDEVDKAQIYRMTRSSPD